MPSQAHRVLSLAALVAASGTTPAIAQSLESLPPLSLAGGFTLAQPQDAEQPSTNRQNENQPNQDDPSLETESTQAGPPSFPIVNFEQSADYRFSPRTGQTGAGGEFGYSRLGYNIGLTNVVSPKWILKADLGVDFYQFDFNRLSGIAGAAGDPVEDAIGVSLAGTTIHNLTETTSLFVRASIGYNGETGAEIQDSITGNAIFAGSKKINDKLTLTGGLAVITRLEDQALVVPIIGFAYDYNDQLSFGTEGLGVQATVRASDDFSILFRVAYDTTDFRLDDQGALPEGVLRVDQIPLTATARWNVIEGLTVEPTLGVMLYQNLTFTNRSGNDVGDAQFDPSIIAGLNVAWSF